jgi:hypothetical protein
MAQHIERLMVTAAACTLAMAAHATDDYNLRVMGLSAYSPAGGNASYEGRDGFTNGNPLQGMVYTPQGGGATVAGDYNPVAFSPNAERSTASPDFLGSAFAPGFPIGSLGFHKADGTAVVNNLIPVGYDAKAIQLTAKGMAPGSVPGANYQGVLFKSNGFDAFTVWDFATPGLGGSYGTRVQASNAANGSFQDLIDLRVVTGTNGATTVRFERIAKDVGGTFTRTTLGSVSFAQIYAGDLAGVDHIALQIYREMPSANNPNPTLSASVGLLDDAVDGQGDLVHLADFTFSAHPTIYQDGNFASASARTGWLTAQPVPEPTTWALMLLGLGAVGTAVRRRARA